MTTTYCLSGHVVLKAGSGAATLTEDQYTDLINQAEAFVNNTMRIDFISGTPLYSSLDDSRKLILRDITSSHAAIGVIQYNQSGFTSNQVTNLLNVNYTRIDEGIKLLKDKNAVAFVQKL